MIEEFLNTERITDAIARSYYEQGDGVLREFKLRVKRRVVLVTISDKGLITIVEIKSSVAEILAHYLPERPRRRYLATLDQGLRLLSHPLR